jgi:hypothetical protein
MSPTSITAFLAGIALSAIAVPRFVAPQSDDQGKDMAQVMSKARKWMQPGPNHKVLERFLGKWNTETTVTGASNSEKGTAEFTWLMDGRWLQMRAKGSVMGMTLDSYRLIGYDNFKMSFVTTAVSSFDTMMIRAEGDMTQSGDALISYGTVDEYLTGERDKMVKTVWRFISKDKIVYEVHDLPIGETNTKVFEIVYTRQ